MMRLEYNFYTLNASGVIDTADVLKLADDQSALVHARDMYHSMPVEIWSRGRKIGLVPPTVDRRGGQRRAS